MMQSVDVISLCSADGEIRPLRIRTPEESGDVLLGNIREILSTKEEYYLGAESRLYLCRTEVGDRSVILELRFHIRSHSWSLIRCLG